MSRLSYKRKSTHFLRPSLAAVKLDEQSEKLDEH